MFRYAQSNAQSAIAGPVSPAQPRPRTRFIQWLKDSEADVYLLALLGCFISYQVTYDLCLKHGMTPDRAFVVAALADFGQFVYSRKALRATKAGRSAWVLRLFVGVLSGASFAINIRDAWPHPTDVGLYSLAPAVWISAHEFMLHGKRSAIKTKRRAEQIAQGLRPAPVAKIGATPFLLAPWPTFRVKRVMWLTRCTPAQAAEILIQRAKNKNKTKIPFFWTALVESGNHPGRTTATIDRDPQPPTPPKLPLPKPDAFDFRKPPVIKSLPPTPQNNTPVDARLALVGTDGSTPLSKLPGAVRSELIAAVPPRTGQRSKPQTIDLVLLVEDICNAHGVEYTGALAAQLLGVHPSRISKIKTQVDAARQKKLSPTGS